MCVRERERERERVCVCEWVSVLVSECVGVCARACVLVCVCVWLCVCVIADGVSAFKNTLLVCLYVHFRHPSVITHCAHALALSHTSTLSLLHVLLHPLPLVRSRLLPPFLPLALSLSCPLFLPLSSSLLPSISSALTSLSLPPFFYPLPPPLSLIQTADVDSAAAAVRSALESESQLNDFCFMSDERQSPLDSLPKIVNSTMLRRCV